MGITPLPSNAELEILAVLWNRGPSTVREVYGALGKERVHTTTLKQMQVMNEKGLLVRSERFRSHVYETGLPREATQQQIVGDLLRRAFTGSVADLVRVALEAQPALKRDAREIRRMLKELEKRWRSR